MGSEQSASQSRPVSFEESNPRQLNFRRQHTIANPGGGNAEPPYDGERPGSTSPGPSVCSDIDLPYISYTVNRPIGDSPKLTNKQQSKPKSSQRKLQSKNVKKTPAHNIVVVKPALSGPNTDRDPDILRLQAIPMFLPIMRATLNLPAARDPEVLERLDPVPMQRMCSRYQNHMYTCANLVATEQNILTQKIREIDLDVAKMVAVASDRLKNFSKHQDKLKKVQELSHQLNKCHILLNHTLESMELLNNYLDIEDRLEPFVWTTG
ncbi:PREDICTED: loss of heterozygosity 12 chromosomal region 1 protein homolog isoform X2 [Nicrophorus vespilloides]|uniref:BLOC-1-related complex subunit 5 n=1 Tax=Nicrophorus vespilloides TaxID=110193 RepID=A0ABM1MS39_NICVS|nr:PREDICTED: loss of heterozygosity 12 chromosomal region 1 protein homolog isoform X2 [Nicrophorus vespilloides]